MILILYTVSPIKYILGFSYWQMFGTFLMFCVSFIMQVFEIIHSSPHPLDLQERSFWVRVVSVFFLDSCDFPSFENVVLIYLRRGMNVLPVTSLFISQYCLFIYYQGHVCRIYCIFKLTVGPLRENFHIYVWHIKYWMHNKDLPIGCQYFF